MIVASGFVETDGHINVENIVSELETRKMEINEVLKTKIVFLIERDTIGAVKSELDAIRNIDGVKNVHLAYYSLEGTDEDSSAGDNA
ncbi:MAG: hypothetical protein ABFR82_04070 [Nitrospirota bacterium]